MEDLRAAGGRAGVRVREREREREGTEGVPREAPKGVERASDGAGRKVRWRRRGRR